MQFNAVVETNGRAVGLWRWLGVSNPLSPRSRRRSLTPEGLVGLHMMHRQLCPADGKLARLPGSVQRALGVEYWIGR